MVIIDTSIAVKWFLPEEGSQEAKDLLEREVLGAPDLLLYELTNVFVSHPKLSPADIEEHLRSVFQIQLQLFFLPDQSYFRIAELSRKFRISGYDASFIVLAESLKAELVTADLKLAHKVKSLPFVHTLATE